MPHRIATGSVVVSPCRVGRWWCAIWRVVAALLVLGSSSFANAQSALDPFDPGANSDVEVLVLQPDGKILLGGQFTMLGGGGTGTTPRPYIGRLNADGSIDAAFSPPTDDDVNAIAMQDDGKILVSGDDFIWRLNPDGSRDRDFDPGTDNTAFVFVVQPDGRILVGGTFETLGGGGEGNVVRHRIGLLNPDGSVDPNFNPGANGTVYAMAVQPDGKIIVAGGFTMLGGGGEGTSVRNRIGRLNPDGSLDPTFDPGANDTIHAIALQPDGKILVGGFFTSLGGGGTGNTPRHYIGRLNTDGSLDAVFDPGADDWIWTIALQPNGKIVVGGDFTKLGSGGMGATPRHAIGRFNANGSLDASFDPGANDRVNILALQPDGKIVVGGDFSTFGGGRTGTAPRNRIARLLADALPLFTDSGPGAASASLQDVHVFELRTRIDRLRMQAGLSAFSWTDLSRDSRVETRSTQVNELRFALLQVYAAVGQQAPAFTTSRALPKQVRISVGHIEELREAVLTLEGR